MFDTPSWVAGTGRIARRDTPFAVRAQVLEKIHPLEQQLAEADAVLRDSQTQLERNQRELSTIDVRVRELKDEYKRRMDEASQLQFLLTKTEDTLDRAQKLLGQLSGEKGRWESTVKDLRRQVASMPTRMLLAAGFATYLAKTPEDVRQSALEGWSKLCEIGEAFDFMRVCACVFGGEWEASRS
jgi:chromosome segregation ATPase